jgi:hypothetical protein
MTLKTVVLRTLQAQKKPVTPEQIHALIPEHLNLKKATVDDVANILTELDQEGYVRNDLLPITSITPKGREYLTR